MRINHEDYDVPTCTILGKELSKNKYLPNLYEYLGKIHIVNSKYVLISINNGKLSITHHPSANFSIISMFRVNGRLCNVNKLKSKFYFVNLDIFEKCESADILFKGIITENNGRIIEENLTIKIK